MEQEQKELQFLCELETCGELSWRIMNLNQLAVWIRDTEQLAGAGECTAMYWLHHSDPDRFAYSYPERVWIEEDFGCGWMTVRICNMYKNVIASTTIERP